LLRRDTHLRAYVERHLVLKHSPEQISRRLLIDFPDDPEMRVSHETIYQSLYVQGRGALKRDLVQCLRTGRALRKPHRKADERRGRPVGAVSISERPAEIEDRAVPGHWEGDLITGAGNGSAIGTLVERATGFVMLLHLPHTHKALDVQEAMTTVMSRLPRTLRRTLTWDQGKEMANHLQIAAATELDIYFCDPNSPWQRGRTKTRTVSFGSIFRNAPTCPAATRTTLSSSPPNSTTDPANDSAGAPPPKRSRDYSHNQTAIHPVLRRPAESTQR
jgi:transposase, IS30 family